MRRSILCVLIGGWAAPAMATEWCPPSSSDFDSWGWTSSQTSGDAWMTNEWCASASQADRDARIELVIADMGLFKNYSSQWAQLMADGGSCNPDSWSGRLLNGAYFADAVGWHRDQDTVAQPYSPGAALPGGETVRYWLSQFVRYYTQDNGWVPRCLAANDPPGPPRYVFAANPTNDDPLKLYYPWFWNLSAPDRASVLVHEAAHEFIGHVADSACLNGGSCDSVYGAANAQSFSIAFNAQAVDAYRRQAGSRQLEIYNYGNEVCGYVPLLPDAVRYELVLTMQARLQQVFEYPPPQSEWPPSAFFDAVVGSIYDLADEPGGVPGLAYRIDLVNSARWPCAAVCDEGEYDFAAGGAKACNEDYQPGNVQVNAHNLALCQELNGLVAAGVTPAEHAELRDRIILERTRCVPGVSEDYVAEVCTALSAQAASVQDIEASWSIPDQGFSFEASKAIAACQAQFCAERQDASWDTAGAAACYEWDDTTGCLARACGDRAAIGAEYGRDSYEYLASLVCRASELHRRFADLKDETDGCSMVFNECVIRERYLPAWEAQLAGGPCWLPSSPAHGSSDPLHRELRDAVGVLSIEPFLALDRESQLVNSHCMMEAVSCEAEQAMLRAELSKLIHDKTRTRPVWKQPTLPDPWEKLEGGFDRDVWAELSELGRVLSGPSPAIGLFARDARLARLVRSPEAAIAIAELVGHDLYLGSGGARFAQGVFAPTKLERFAAGGAADPYALPTDGHAAELAAMRSVSLRLASPELREAFGRSARLSGPVAYGHLVNLLSAKSAVELGAALDAFVADTSGP